MVKAVGLKRFYFLTTERSAMLSRLISTTPSEILNARVSFQAKPIRTHRTASHTSRSLPTIELPLQQHHNHNNDSNQPRPSSPQLPLPTHFSQKCDGGTVALSGTLTGSLAASKSRIAASRLPRLLPSHSSPNFLISISRTSFFIFLSFRYFFPKTNHPSVHNTRRARIGMTTASTMVVQWRSQV